MLAVADFFLPFFLLMRQTPLPFAYKVEASPTNIDGAGFSIVALYWTNMFINSYRSFIKRVHVIVHDKRVEGGRKRL